MTVENIQFMAEPITFSDGGMDEEGRKVPAFTMTAYTGGKMVPAGGRQLMVLSLAGMSWPDKGVPARLNHSVDAGVGFIDEIEHDGKKLQASGRITRKTAAALDVLESARDGHPWQASVGVRFSADDTQLIKTGEKKLINGRMQEGPFVLITKSRLAEISFTDAGADPDTETRLAAMDGSPSPERNPNMSDSSSRKPDNNTDPAPSSPAHAPGAAASASGNFSADSPEMFEKARRRKEFLAKVQRDCDQTLEQSPWLVDQVERFYDQAKTGQIDSYDDFRRRLGRVASQSNFQPGIPEDAGINRQKVLECAMCRTEMLPNLEKHFSPDVIDRANKEYPGPIGPATAMYEAVRANGKSLRPGDLRGLMRESFSRDTDAEFNFSTVDVPNLLSNVANKFAAQAFEADEESLNSWRAVAAVRPVRDYKTNTLVTLGLNQGMQDLAPGGEIQHTTPLETSYTIRAKTRASMLSINHEILKNDDIGELARLPREFAMNAMGDLAKGVWTTFMATTGNFFHADKGNLYEDAAAALSIDSFGYVRTLLRKQTRPNGEPLNLSPRYLIVPPELWGIAKQLQSSTTIAIGVGSTAKVQGVNNPWSDTFTPIESEYLSNTAITNNSAKAWYLVTDPNRLASVIVGFMDGRETPTIETANADFNTLGIQMRCVFDWGVAKGEYRAAAKSKGEA